MKKLQINALRFHNLGPIDLTIQTNECIVISGPSGAGKTLFLRAIADLDPHSGQLFLDNKASAHFTPTEWRKNIGLLPATSEWWYETVGEHFTFTEPSWFAKLGFDLSILKRQIAGLSTGERQRLALLRLLTNKPAVLLLDEATANLDNDNTERMEELIQTYSQQQAAAIIWVSHNKQQIARIAHQHFILNNGTLTRAK
jgi:ABC-type iron transport system FetAB ATPase subunit